jgi:hypothetical protein
MSTPSEGRALFLRRLEKEGRLKEYRERVKEWRIKQRLDGEKPNPFPEPVMREFGFLSFVDERMRAGAAESDALAEALESEMTGLPTSAPAVTELDWINGHPAMLRAPDQTGNVALCKNDVNGTSVGPAPSKRAVAALAHWVNHKIEFYRQMMSVQKKETDSKESHSKIKTRRDVEEIQEILRGLREGVTRRCTKCGHLIDD